MFLEGDSTPAITFVLTTSQWYCNWSGQSSSFGNLFYLEHGTTGTITSSSCTYSRCYAYNSGGIFFLPPGTSLSDTSSSFTSNRATDGGNFYCDGCDITLTGTTLNSITATSNGGNIYVTTTAPQTSTLLFD